MWVNSFGPKSTTTYWLVEINIPSIIEPSEGEVKRVSCANKHTCKELVLVRTWEMEKNLLNDSHKVNTWKLILMKKGWFSPTVATLILYLTLLSSGMIFLQIYSSGTKTEIDKIEPSSLYSSPAMLSQFNYWTEASACMRYFTLIFSSDGVSASKAETKTKTKTETWPSETKTETETRPSEIKTTPSETETLRIRDQDWDRDLIF